MTIKLNISNNKSAILTFFLFFFNIFIIVVNLFLLEKDTKCKREINKRNTHSKELKSTCGNLKRVFATHQSFLSPWP